MSSSFTEIGSRPVGRQVAAAIAGILTGGAVVAGVLLSFDGAGPEHWLAPTPEVMDLAAGCDRQLDRATRERCKQQLVAARLARERQPLAVAKADALPGAAAAR